MKVHYDGEVDALYLEFHPVEPGTTEARQLNEVIIANYGPGERLVGLEILNASRVLGHVNDNTLVEADDGWDANDLADVRRASLLYSEGDQERHSGPETNL